MKDESNEDISIFVAFKLGNEMKVVFYRAFSLEPRTFEQERTYLAQHGKVLLDCHNQWLRRERLRSILPYKR